MAKKAVNLKIVNKSRDLLDNLIFRTVYEVVRIWDLTKLITEYAIGCPSCQEISIPNDFNEDFDYVSTNSSKPLCYNLCNVTYVYFKLIKDAKKVYFLSRVLFRTL